MAGMVKTEIEKLQEAISADKQALTTAIEKGQKVYRVETPARVAKQNAETLWLLQVGNTWGNEVILKEDGNPELDEEGNPKRKPVFIPAGEIRMREGKGYTTNPKHAEYCREYYGYIVGELDTTNILSLVNELLT